MLGLSRNYRRILWYSVLVGLLIALFIYFGGYTNLSDERRQLIEASILNNAEISAAIGRYEKLSVKKVTKYFGSPDDAPYVKYVLRVVGDKGSVWVKLTVNNPESSHESSTITNIEE